LRGDRVQSADTVMKRMSLQPKTPNDHHEVALRKRGQEGHMEMN